MTPSPSIYSIYMCTKAGSKMVRKDKVKLVQGIGIEGDRYALGVGAFSNSNLKKNRDITLITKIGIDISNRLLKYDGLAEFDASETRRNVVIDQILPTELNALVGKVFYLGKIKLMGEELCEPCERPSKLLNKKGFKTAYDNNGGIRAQVLDSGEITIGDLLVFT
ncbi:MAG: sulfurase [Chloroflexi bacterium]|nr:sulfurase [Chloroflexota bacterium]